MKKLHILIASAIFTASLFAQSPEKMSYQAIVKDASDNLVRNQSIGIQINILQGSLSGTAVYVERHFPTTNSNGLVTMEIGNGTRVSGDISAIDWANGPYFIKTETDLNGGANYTITGTSQLLSVPYALHAKTAESITDTISETDPVFGASVASAITATDTAYWSNKLDTVTKAYVDARIIELLCQQGIGTVSDYDGNEYEIVKIGNQVWMAENLAYLPSVSPPSNGSYTVPYYYVSGYEGTSINEAKSTDNYQTYGVLYNWPAANEACPTGWHLPSDDEWKELEMFLGMSQAEADGYLERGTDEGGKLKEAGSTHWPSTNIGATNSSGFTALPGGWCLTGTEGGFHLFGAYALFWTSTQHNIDSYWYRRLGWENSKVFRANNGITDNGFSIRCVKD